LTGYSKCDC